MLEGILYGAFIITAILIVVLYKQLGAAKKRYQPPKAYSPLGKEVDLPSVTVCIPARNEQHALAYCLEKVVASEYDKLEIIVLDDVSGDDTSALIKSFASEGVRFVKGAALQEGWLGKNHALQGLLNEASGSYVFFMDVDTRLSPLAIENVVRYAISHRAAMVSVLPYRGDGWRTSVIFSPLRYFWEIMLARKSSPPSASNAWLINRQLLVQRFNGLETFKHAIQPEAKIADRLSLSNEYRFLISNSALGVSYEKKWRSQLVTSIRLLFPLCNNSVGLAFLAVLALSCMLLPFFVFIGGVITQFERLHYIAFTLSLAEVILYGVYTRQVWSRGWLVGAFLFAFLLIQEIFLIISSVVQYKRKTVQWKGRAIQPQARN
jgi:glycosyltransferase involved in cell wall biosynthesis